VWHGLRAVKLEDVAWACITPKLSLDARTMGGTRLILGI
jgi:hypothetical protein